MDTTLKTLLLLATMAVSLTAQDQERDQGGRLPMRPEVAAQPVLAPFEAHSDAVLEFYEVGDISGFAAADIRHAQLLQSDVGYDDEAWRKQIEVLEGERQRAINAAADLATMISAYITPSFDEFPGQVRSMAGSSLVAHCTPAQQLWVQAFLQKQRADRGVITVKAQVLSVEPGTFAKLGYSSKTTITMLETEQQEALLAELEDAGVQWLTAPALSTLPRQRGELKIVNEQSFIVDWLLHVVQPGDRKIADPIIETVQEGLVVSMQAVPLPEGTYGLALFLEHTEIEQPVETMELVLDEELDPLEMTLLTRHLFTVDTTVVMPSGSQALFVASGTRKRHEVAVLLSLSASAAMPGH